MKLLAVAVFSLCAASASAWAADDPQVGHWKLDLAKSKYVTATAPMSSEAKVEPSGKNGLALTVDQVTPKGTFHIQYSAQFDGKDYPRTESGPGATTGQTVSLKRIGSRTVERVVHFQGKPAGTEKWVISKDGKTRTVTQSGIDLHGKPINNLQVYRRE
jgi:hypothetical protein